MGITGADQVDARSGVAGRGSTDGDRHRRWAVAAIVGSLLTVAATVPALASTNAGPRAGRTRPVGDGGDVEEMADSFGCFSGCSNSLARSRTCLSGRDYTTATTDKSSPVAVLSFHGGAIEPGSSELSAALSRSFGWSRYDFNAHPTSACRRGKTTFARLHITATNFNDPDAVALVEETSKAVAIHGYSPSRGLGVGEICVGGANDTEVGTFISALARYHARFSGYRLRGLDATAGASGCSGLTGTASANLVNRNANGGLQLEMSNGIKADLANSSSTYRGLRSAFFAAISDAMAT